MGEDLNGQGHGWNLRAIGWSTVGFKAGNSRVRIPAGILLKFKAGTQVQGVDFRVHGLESRVQERLDFRV